MSDVAEVLQFYEERAENCKELIKHYARAIRTQERLLVSIEHARFEAMRTKRFIPIHEPNVTYARFTEAQVAAVHRGKRLGIPMTQLARQLGCHRTTIAKILKATQAA